MEAEGIFGGEIEGFFGDGIAPDSRAGIEGPVLGGEEAGHLVAVAEIIFEDIEVGQPGRKHPLVDHNGIEPDIGEDAAVAVAAAFGVGDVESAVENKGGQVVFGGGVKGFSPFGGIDGEKPQAVASDQLDGVSVDDPDDPEAVAGDAVGADLSGHPEEDKGNDEDEDNREAEGQGLGSGPPFGHGGGSFI